MVFGDASSLEKGEVEGVRLHIAGTGGRGYRGGRGGWREMGNQGDRARARAASHSILAASDEHRDKLCKYSASRM